MVSSEEFHFKDVTHNRIRQFEVRQGKLAWSDDGVLAQSFIPLLPRDQLCLGHLGEPMFLAFADSLRYMGIYNFHPEAIRRLQKVGIGYRLERDRQQSRQRHRDAAREGPPSCWGG